MSVMRFHRRIQTIVLICFAVSVGSHFGCEDVSNLFNQEEKPEWYPHVLRYNPIKFDEMMKRWAELKTAYGIGTPIDVEFDSVVPVIRMIYGSRIDLFPDREGEIPSDSIAMRLYQFLDRWQDLFHVDSRSLVITEVQKEYSIDSTRAWYRFRGSKSFSYSLPQRIFLKGFQADVYPDGRIFYLGSEGIPQLEIPMAPGVDERTAKQSVLGKQIVYYDWSGPKVFTVTDDEIDSVSLEAVVLPRFDESSRSRIQSLEYRLCWIYHTWLFDICADAITGEDLNFYFQNIVF